MASHELPVTSPPEVKCCAISYPAPWVLLVTINRPKQMNSIPYAGHWEMEALFTWFDQEPNLRVAIITGAGNKAFCAGQDLIELGEIKTKRPPVWAMRHPPSGFCGLSRRNGKKPVIAAVNGYALGGGFETSLNCDLVIASPTASFSVPEVQRGLYAGAGGLPRLIRNCGLQIASEIALTGRRLTAQEVLGYHLINKISANPDTLIQEALDLAASITKNSPDAVIVSRKALREAWESPSIERAASVMDVEYKARLMTGDNCQEGLLAFAEKRAPRWGPAKL